MQDTFTCLSFFIPLLMGAGFSVLTWKPVSQREPDKVAPDTGPVSIMCRKLVNLYIHSLHWDCRVPYRPAPGENWQYLLEGSLLDEKF